MVQAGEEGAKAGANAGAEAMYYKEFGLSKKQIKDIARKSPMELQLASCSLTPVARNSRR